MKKILLILLIGFLSNTYGQTELNDYKYIIVPKQFDAFKQQNQYKTSTLVKHLLTEKGFNVIYDDQLPAELSNNRCMGLTANLLDNSNMFTTKTSVVFKDCNSKEIFILKEGVSKQKEFDLSYAESINKSFETISSYAYVYNKKASEPITISYKNDVKKLEENTQTSNVQEVIVEEVEKISPAIATSTTTPNTDSNIFYAQSIENGYQLVDSTPKIVMKMFKTSQQNIFIGEEESGASGLLYSKNNQWYFEYYLEGKLLLKTLNIKF